MSRPAPLSGAGADAAHLFRAPDGKPLPLAADAGGDYGFELIYGLPGQGKSVLMNALGLAFSLQGGQARLPLAAVIDIGPSSSGLVSLVREALPPERRHEAGWFPLRMTAAHAINPCDTQLGCRAPLPAERAFLTNLLSLMVTPAGAGGAPDGMRELIGPALSKAYALRSDREAGGEPHAYTKGRDAEVDAAIAACGLELPDRPLWWEVVDLLFEAGAIEAAARAQRYAVPVLGDLLASVREPAVQGLVGDAAYGAGGESVTQAFTRILTALSGDWPVMFSPTAFDIGGARLAAIDLAEVAPQGSAEADRQTAAFYLLARHALTRHWWIGEDALAAIPEPYRAWHAARLRDIRESPKRLCYDEFHRTAGAPAVRAQVERDVREARKLRVRLALASQRLEDFGGALAELANRYWILGSGGKAREAETLAALFSLSDTLTDTVRYRLTGPGRDGAPALLIAAGTGGRFEQLVVNTPGPVELWALTTSPADVALRRRVYALMPPARARATLARAFPTGTARGRIESELARMDAPGSGAAASEEAVLDRLADELARATAHDSPDSSRPVQDRAGLNQERRHGMLHINRVTLLGHAGRDPGIRMKTDGGKVASFSLATTRRWKDEDGQPAEATEWHRIVVFGGAVRVVEEMVRKGAPLLVEGRIARREYQDKEGRQQHVTEIVVGGTQGMVNLLAPKPGGGASAPGVEDPGGDGDA